ncbi:hypothetical protein [Pseudoduganella violaceinigra]|uniref:hypothetical protein n=1 Tax=Pseudoduganella violaceinigra TaxID=246602 RepID=UPI0004070F92|nr:hypothetical protein [Pseudoduganella violaceinigra]
MNIIKLACFAAGLATSVAALAAAPAAAAKPAAPAQAAAPAAAPVQTRDVPVNQFMQGRLPFEIALNVPVPVDYEQSKVKKIGYSYWMRPADAVTATAAALPSHNGYMYGSTATNVTYDAQHHVFYGIDDPGSINKLKGAATNIQVKQFKDAKHPAVMVSMISGTTGQPAYFMYMATGKKNETFFLSFRAPDGRPDIGDAVWAKLAAAIK